MTAKTYLRKIRAIEENINDGLEELAQLDALRTKVTASFGGEAVASSKDPDKLTNITCKIIRLKIDINKHVDKYVDIKREAAELLAQVENTVHRKILHSRYVLDKTWEQIADEIGYTYQWTCHLHGVALLEFERIMQKNGIVDRN